MPNHLSSIGFTITDESEYKAVVRQLRDQAVPVDTKAGRYLWKRALLDRNSEVRVVAEAFQHHRGDQPCL